MKFQKSFSIITSVKGIAYSRLVIPRSPQDQGLNFDEQKVEQTCFELQNFEDYITVEIMATGPENHFQESRNRGSEEQKVLSMGRDLIGTTSPF